MVLDGGASSYDVLVVLLAAMPYNFSIPSRVALAVASRIYLSTLFLEYTYCYYSIGLVYPNHIYSGQAPCICRREAVLILRRSQYLRVNVYTYLPLDHANLSYLLT